MSETFERLKVYFTELEGHAPDILETHGAWVFLSGDYAYKLKKPVDFPYMDYSTLPLRKTYCEREIILNQRTAPDIYLDALTVIEGEFDLQLGKAVPEGHKALDYVVHMQRFAQDDLLSDIVEKKGISAKLIDGICENIVRLHASAEVFTDKPDNIKIIGEGNDLMFAQQTDVLPRKQTVQLTADTADLAEKLKSVLVKRAKNGMIRQCHGDMHLGNICLWQGKPTLFDCIEFNDDFAVIDVLYDLAFLIMDLRFQNMEAAADEVMRQYKAVLPQESRDMEKLMPLFVSVRAAIRAHVSVTMGKGQLANSYLQFARHALTA